MVLTEILIFSYHLPGGGGGGGGGELRELRGSQFIYLAFEKPFIHSIIQNIDLFIYCLLIFVPIYCLLLDKYRSQFIEKKRKSNIEKFLSEKYVHTPGCQKSGAFHIGIQKNRVIHILFVEKRGPILYLAALKRGHSACRSVLSHV